MALAADPFTYRDAAIVINTLRDIASDTEQIRWALETMINEGINVGAETKRRVIFNQR